MTVPDDDFVTPSADWLESEFGIGLISLPGEPTVQEFEVVSTAGEKVQASFDLAGRSVRVRSSGVAFSFDLFREAARRLELDYQEPSYKLKLTYGASGIE